MKVSRNVVIIAIGLPLLVMLPFASHFPQSIPVVSAMHGQVIDHTLDQPLAGATVLAIGNFAENAIVHTATGCVFTELTHTDAEGEYYIPSHWSDLELGIPGLELRQWWDIYVLKTGYSAFELTQFYQGIPRALAFANWFSGSRSYSWRVVDIHILPIELKQGELGFEERVGDLVGLKRNVEVLGCRSDAATQQQIQAIFDGFYREQEKYVCGSPADTVTNYEAVRNLNWLVPSFNGMDRFSAQIRESVPSYKLSMAKVPPKGLLKFDALCKAMRAGEGP